MTQTGLDSSVRPNLHPVLWTARLAGVLSALVNIMIWLALRGKFDTIRVGPPGEEMPFWSGAVVLFSLVGALGAGVVYTLIARFIRVSNRAFLGVAVAVLLVSFVTPLSIRTHRRPWSSGWG